MQKFNLLKNIYTKKVIQIQYENIRQAKFIFRPNRFIANIEINGAKEIAHVKNTGRCKELLLQDSTIFVQEFDSAKRKTKYDLIAVYKGNTLINMDSQVTNKVFYQWVQNGNFVKDITLIKPEFTYQNSRFDFYIETKTEKIFVEVKGATLEENGVVRFPDAPTQRGVKHVNELCSAVDKGYKAYVVFIIQMENVKYFTPNDLTHKAFGDALRSANKLGVNILALNCKITQNSIDVIGEVPIML